MKLRRKTDMKLKVDMHNQSWNAKAKFGSKSLRDDDSVGYLSGMAKPVSPRRKRNIPIDVVSRGEVMISPDEGFSVHSADMGLKEMTLTKTKS